MTQLEKSSVESEQPLEPLGGALTVVALAVSLALFLGGILLLGWAFEVPSSEVVLFAIGLGSVTLGLFIPLQVLRHVDGA